jgi:hypothetical protein
LGKEEDVEVIESGSERASERMEGEWEDGRGRWGGREGGRPIKRRRMERIGEKGGVGRMKGWGAYRTSGLAQ